MEITETDFTIKKVKIEVKDEANNVELTVKEYNKKPSGLLIEKSDKIYKYVQIDVKNLRDKLNKGIITIQIKKSWLTENNLDKSNIAVFKYSDEGWSELETKFIEGSVSESIITGGAVTSFEEDSDYYFYDIETDSFGYFVIGSKSISESLLDVRVEIPRNFLRVAPGRELFTEITLLRAKGIDKIDVLVKYVIKNEKGEEIYTSTETVAIETKTSFVKSFQIPEEIAVGNYILYVTTKYNGEIATSNASFSVIEKKFWGGENMIFIIIIIIIIILLFILYELKRLKKEIHLHNIDEHTLYEQGFVKPRSALRAKPVKKITRGDELKKLVEHVGKNL